MSRSLFSRRLLCIDYEINKCIKKLMIRVRLVYIYSKIKVSISTNIKIEPGYCVLVVK